MRRLAAAVYDALLLGGVLMLTSLFFVMARDGEAIPPGSLAYQLALLLILTLFFVGFWTRGGQTLGMQAWRLRVQTPAGDLLGWPQALLRFAAAWVAWLPFGLGLLWLIFDREHLAWHDRLSNSRVVLLPKGDFRPS